MKTFERLLFLSILTVALFAPACESVSVPPWPYVREAQEAGAATDGAASDGAIDGVENPPSKGTPLACDGALCDTTNYSACNVANNPAESRDAWPISLELIVSGLTLARIRTRRKTESAR